MKISAAFQKQDVSYNIWYFETIKKKILNTNEREGEII